MRLGNVQGRLVLVDKVDHYVDVEAASGGRFGSDVQSVYDQWEAFSSWFAQAADGLDFAQALERNDLGAPVPSPRQIFAVGLNYREHASESGFAVPEQPTVFTKFASSLTGPLAEVVLPEGGNTDWEVELVAVIGTRAHQVPVEQAWSYVAGLTVGQDISERVTQAAGPAPQFSLGKSFSNFGPTGPLLVSPDEFADPDDIELGCSVNGEQMQKGRTRDLVFSVPELVARLSKIVTLFPGDLIFTGTPAGVGLGRSPQVWLSEGDELVSWIEGIGEIRQNFVAATA
jgi:2-keto-4-pentenoate hydratase/2-oxohepta-3-ene-1,7-dioic acid hydratase in catechol pathway